MKKLISLLLLLSLLAAGTTGCGSILAQILPSESHFTQNTFELPETRESVPGALEVFGGEDIGFSFLYPCGMSLSWNETDGACICETDGQIPYVLISKTEKTGMTPEKYFRSSDKQMVKEFDSVQSSTIHQVPLDGKTLYMTRYQCVSDGTELVIDRYIEIYPDCYIQYTAVTTAEDEMNTALYYAATTLSPEEGCYIGEYSEELQLCVQDDTGISLQIPTMLDTKELTIGYFASCNDALLLAVLCTEDDNGDPIYNRQNFMDRAAANPNFVADYLGTDSAVFGSGTTQKVNGQEFYVYPMTLQTEDEQFAGEIFLANAEESGCIVLCYAVRNDSPRYEALRALCKRSLNTVAF